MIHSTAVIDPSARLGVDVSVGPYAIVEAGVEIGDGSILAPHAVVRAGTSMGAGCRVDSFAVLGGEPNFIGFDPKTASGLKIGDRCTFREGVTVHRSIHADQTTRVGDDCFFMAGSHIGHDCQVGDRIVLANQAALAGHVTMGNDSFFGGGAMIHQFSRVGDGAMVAGLSRITRDVAPFIMIGERDEVAGLNLIGLRRRKAPTSAIRELKTLFQAILRSPGKPVELAAALPSPSSSEGKTFIEFFVPSKRGYAKSVVS